MPESIWGLPRPVDPALVDAARRVVAAGGSLDAAAASVLERTRSPIDASKALRAAASGLTLGEATQIVRRSLERPTRDQAGLTSV